MPLKAHFEWIPIPAGKVTIEGEVFGYVRQGRTSTFDVPAFHISKHPISNAQFAQFIAAGGYSQSRWWSQSGWLVKEHNGWKTPLGWNQSVIFRRLPVTGVSWFEAVAFCLWLIDQTRASVMLPTEQQWQRAAENTSSSSGINLSENIIEWCVTGLNTGKPYLDLNSTYLYDQYLNDPDDDWTSPVMLATNFVMRGGSWDEGPADPSDVANRRWSQPHERHGRRGFRIAVG